MMRLEIVSKLASFKDKILNYNRFFISDDPFLIELKKYIEQDLKRENPTMISSLSKKDVIYRARVMDHYLNGDTYYITKMMQACGQEFSGIENCKSCKERDSCNCDKPSKESAEHFKNSAKEAFKKMHPSSGLGFYGFDKLNSSLPPKNEYKVIPDARANPKYIRYLYAANDKYTALLEARSNINSLVSIANIEILDTLKIFDISNTKTDDDDLFDLLYALNDEFSTPASGELKDYLTTQIITEFIKCIDCDPKFDGICFNSSFNPQGKNYTIFNEGKCNPISSEVYYIQEIGLRAYGVTEPKVVEISSDNPNPA